VWLTEVTELREHARILIVDDEASIRKTFSAILEEKGYIVETVENGKEAIEKTKTRFFNVALIDVRLPDMEGTALLTAMQETAPRMVKIIVTGYPAMKNAVEAVNNGANVYVLKPPSMADLIGTIEEQLRRQQEEKRYSQEKIAEFIQLRIAEVEAKDPR
jgi:DNA-binding NtrC family response regulator